MVNDERRVGKIQKIYSSAKVLNLSVRVPGETLQISIGRGADICGVWLIDKNIPSEYRIVKDRLLEYFRSNIKGKAIKDILVDPLDRAICIEMLGEHKLFFFWLGRKLYFSHLWLDEKDSSWKEFSPWKSLSINSAQCNDFEIFNELGRKKLEVREPKINEYTIKSEEFFVGGIAKKKVFKKIDRKIKLIEKDLNACKKGKELQEKLIMDEFDLAGDTFKWNGIKCKFRHDDTYYDKKNKVFTKIKKLKIGEAILEDRLKEAKSQLEDKESIQVEEKIIFPVWSSNRKNNSSIQKSENENVKLFKYENLSIAVGLNAKANDWIRKDWAKKDDLWMHLDEYKSSHIFIKGDHQFSIELYSLFASILADYSDFQADQIPVIFTQVSNLKGVKGKSGLVNYKKEKHITLNKVNWKEIISMGW